MSRLYNELIDAAPLMLEVCQKLAEGIFQYDEEGTQLCLFCGKVKEWERTDERHSDSCLVRKARIAIGREEPRREETWETILLRIDRLQDCIQLMQEGDDERAKVRLSMALELEKGD